MHVSSVTGTKATLGFKQSLFVSGFPGCPLFLWPLCCRPCSIISFQHVMALYFGLKNKRPQMSPSLPAVCNIEFHNLFLQGCLGKKKLQMDNDICMTFYNFMRCSLLAFALYLRVLRMSASWVIEQDVSLFLV